MPFRKTIPQKCQNCGRYFVVGEYGVAEDKEERLQRRGLPTRMLGDILGDKTRCVCGAAVFMEVEVSEDHSFVCGRALGRHFRWHEPRWNNTGDHLAWLCQTCLKKENKQVKADKKRGLVGRCQYPEWDDDGKIVIHVR